MNHHFQTPFQRLTLAAVVVAAWPPLALAQATPATTERVTVTGQALRDGQQAPSLATGVAASALETPFSANRVSAEQVREQGGSSIQDALRSVPGAQADSGFNGSHTQFFILRGAISDSGTGSSRVLRDGARLSNYPYVPAFIESVDVLRGPGAALGVRSEPGGTVNLSTKQAQLANFGSVYLRAGSADAREASVDINRVLLDEQRLAARVIVTRSESSQWRHVPDKLDGIKLGLATADAQRYQIRLGFEATNQTYQPDYGLPSLDGRVVDVPRDRQLSEPFADSTTDNRIADLRADVALAADTQLSLSLTHLEAKSTSIKNPLFGNPLANQPRGTWARVLSWEPDTTRRVDAATLSLTHRQNWAGFVHQLYVGLGHYEEKLHQPNRSAPAANSPSINVFNPVYGRVTAPANPSSLPVSLTTQDLSAQHVSLQDRIDLGAWTVAAGVRLDRQGFLFGSVGTRPIEESRWSPKLAVLYRVQPDHTVYANLSTGTAPNQVSSATGQSLPSRRAEQAELGWKALWNEGRLISELAVYRLDQTNMISSDLSTPAGGDFTVDGAARSQGLEATLSGTLGSQLDIKLAYAYTDAAYLQNAVYANKRVPNVARQSANLWASYRWGPGLRTGLAVQAVGARWADINNLVMLPGHAKVDLVQGWRLPLSAGQSLDLQLALRNLFDKGYFVSSHVHVARWVSPGQGRNVAMSASYRF